jgi:hypothetical protein
MEEMKPWDEFWEEYTDGWSEQDKEEEVCGKYILEEFYNWLWDHGHVIV